jgi:hypothetical protein
MAQNYLPQMLDAYQFYQEHDHFFVAFLFPHVWAKNDPNWKHVTSTKGQRVAHYKCRCWQEVILKRARLYTSRIVGLEQS